MGIREKKFILVCLWLSLFSIIQLKAQTSASNLLTKETPFLNFGFIITAILLITSLLLAYLLLKKNQKLTQALKTAQILEEKNQIILQQSRELTLKGEEIAAQNEELKQIQAELAQQIKYTEANSLQLQKANRRHLSNEKVMIKAVKKLKEQENIIKTQNENLEYEVNLRTQELSQKNQELIDYTHQLEQFAFVTGHNLRAPIARLLGLVSIIDLENLSNPDNRLYIKNLEIVTKELDSIIIDLNKVLEVKKTDQIYLEPINFREKINRIVLFLEQVYHQINFEIITDFSAVEEINSVNIYWESILYNLISNAIKYRHPERISKIYIQTDVKEDSFIVRVKDNGIGIDLAQHREKLFGLYKRFHQHVEGKGLGLHLVKLQVESLSGKISVESEINEGTIFTIEIPNFFPDNAQ